jgi:hypothetical protein
MTFLWPINELTLTKVTSRKTARHQVTDLTEGSTTRSSVGRPETHDETADEVVFESEYTQGSYYKKTIEEGEQIVVKGERSRQK